MVEPRLLLTAELLFFSRLFFSNNADKDNGCTAFVLDVENERGLAIGPKLLQPPLLLLLLFLLHVVTSLWF